MALLCVTALPGCDQPSVENHVERAQEFLDRSRPLGAIAELKTALQKQPENGALRFMLGKTYLSLGRLEDAEKEMLRARDFGGDAVAATLALGEIWHRQGRHTKIIADLKETPDWPPSALPALLALRASAQLSLGDRVPADATYRRILSLDPKNSEALIGVVRVAQLAQDQEALRQGLDSALLVAPEDDYLLHLKAGLAFREQDYAAAVTTFRVRLARNPQAFSAKLGLAQALMAGGETDEAKVLLQEVAQALPSNASAHYLLAVIAFGEEAQATARFHSLKALAADPDHRPSQFIAGLSSYALGRYREARWYLGLIAQDDPTNETAATLLAEADRQVQQAEAAAAEGPSLEPLTNDLVLFRLTDREIGTELRPLLEAGDRKAVALLEDPVSSAELRDGDPRLLALANLRAGEGGRSRLLLDRYLQDHPDDLTVRSVLADLYILDGEIRKAEPHLRHLLTARPDSAAVLNNLAWVLSNRGAVREALPLAERALALAPNDPRVMDTLGLTLLRLGEPERAIPLLAKAVRQETAGPETAIHLAQALRDRGEIAAAKVVLEGLLAADEAKPAHGAAEALLRALQTAQSE